MKYCTNCGKELPEGQNFCGNCGTMINNSIIDETRNYQQQVIDNLNIQTTNSEVIAYSNKRKLTAGLLAIFLGIFGAHNFYLGKTGKAIFQLALTLISFFSGIIMMFISMFLYCAVFFVWIWAIIEAIIIFKGKATDKWGKIVKN